MMDDVKKLGPARMRVPLILAMIVLTTPTCRKEQPQGDLGARGARPVAHDDSILPSAFVSSDDATHWRIDDEVVRQLLLAGLMGDLRATNTSGGIRIDDIRAGSAFERVGLRRGDHMTAVAGVPLIDRTSIPSVYARARKSRHFAVALVREGRPLELNYTVISAHDRLAPLPAPLASGTLSGAPSCIGLATPTEMDAAIKKVSDTGYEITRSLAEKIVSDPGAIARCARLVPYYERGMSAGFKLFAIRPGSFFAKLGIMNGDIVHALNGHELTSPDSALDAYKNVKNAKTVVVSITRRGGERLDLRYVVVK